MCQTKKKMHNQCHISWRKMWQPSVIYLIVIVQTAGWWRLGLARPSDLEANDMYRDLLSQNGAPEIESYKPEVELEAGISFEMTCTANEPIRWHIKRTDQEDIEPPLVTVESIVTNDADKPYGMKVTIPETSAEVVGRYYCVFESVDNSDHTVNFEDLEAEYKATSTYVFVKDPKSPLVPITHALVVAQQYEDVVIPCKPSSKDVIVELVKDEQGYNETCRGAKFDPAKGFLLRNETNEFRWLPMYHCNHREHTQSQPFILSLQNLEAPNQRHCGGSKHAAHHHLLPLTCRFNAVNNANLFI